MNILVTHAIPEERVNISFPFFRSDVPVLM